MLLFIGINKWFCNDPTKSVLLNLSAWLISHVTVFFSHNKSALAGLSAAETISRTALTRSNCQILISENCPTMLIYGSFQLRMITQPPFYVIGAILLCM
jgi:hypothetical protein